jgi:hypothetical protein
MALTSKKFVAEKGILSSPNVKPCKVLPHATDEMMKRIYVSDELSRVTPGIKEGKKVHLQK